MQINLQREQKEFTNANGKLITYYEYFYIHNCGQKVVLKAVFNEGKVLLKLDFDNKNNKKGGE